MCRFNPLGDTRLMLTYNRQGGGSSFALGDEASQAKHRSRLCFGRESLNVSVKVCRTKDVNGVKEIASITRIMDVNIIVPQRCGEGVHNVRNQKITNYLRSFATGPTRNREFQTQGHVSSTRHSARLGVLLVRALRGARVGAR